MKPQTFFSPAGLVTLLSMATSIDAQTSGETCCDLLGQAGLSQRLFTISTETYVNAEATYWSLDNANRKPKCIFMPQTADEVATAIKALNGPAVSNVHSKKTCNKGCKFAVRGAGHMANPGANNINDGVTIDFSAMTTTTYHADRSIASIQPGTRWGSVYTELAKYETMVLGGRASTVGVSGLILGGGNSFYSSQRGFACDGVANFEVVLADGSIVNANATNEHADLYRALKGGSSNFGIVTRYDLNTFTAPATLWGGTIGFAASAGAQLISTLQKFVSVLGDEGHQSDSAIVFWTYTQGGGLPEPIIISALHNVEGKVDAPGLADFVSIPGNVSFAMRTDSLVAFTDELEVPRGSYNSWRTLTFKNSGEVMTHAVDTYNAMVKEFEAEAPTLGFTAQCMFQGLSVNQFKQAAVNGGNVLGLDDRTDNLIMFLGMLAYKDPSLESLVNAKMTAWVDDIKKFAASKGADDEYLFLNYAHISQSPFRSYGQKNLAFMKEVADKYDPRGVFQINMPGGFKISKA
ncbi:FAD binding domain-containing protein [Pyricularia oryzae]|nr:FAD binding domain-containing protein [Pyricularia oryzae]KAI7910762.1 FAD binding domain-containing protein [Pyricularia oryzae]